MRECQQCSMKMAPFQPRKRVGEALLCAKCAQNPNGYPHTLISAEARKIDRHSVAGASRDDYWPQSDGLHPTPHVHPLAAPLPNKVWENYAKKKRLMGKPILSPAQIRHARGDTVSKQAAAEDVTQVHTWRGPEGAEEEQAHKDHLIQHHGFNPFDVADMSATTLALNHTNHHANEVPKHFHSEDGVVGLKHQGQAHEAAEDMMADRLLHHIQRHHAEVITPDMASRDDLIAAHNKHHAEKPEEFKPGWLSAHHHVPPNAEKKAVGDGPEVVRPHDMHSMYEHLAQEHPEISLESLSTHLSNIGLHSGDPHGYISHSALQEFHDGIHGVDRDSYLYPANGHTHAAFPAPDVQVHPHKHLATYHGVGDDVLREMTPHQAATYHQHMHQADDDDKHGHSHLGPGGPVIDPVPTQANPHHQPRRGTNHPAALEWYHGTESDYQGPPQSATELGQQGLYSRYGDNDWNCHLGSHWTSLHDMAQGFGGGNRVIHARLKMRNPIVYNSLNHMAHDAYDRLVAAGEIDDDAEGTRNKIVGNHKDDLGEACCSGRLLRYAQGSPAWRTDGHHGLQKYRDSLRADGHDGIVVRNQADHPRGQWNAIPLSPDDIDITDPHCRGGHGDARHGDINEHLNDPESTRNWHHPKPFKPYFAPGKDRHPTGDEITEFRKTSKRANFGDSDYPGQWEQGDNEPQEYCESCGEHGHDETEHHEYCHVCEENNEHGDDPGSEHPFCDHCDDLADHESHEHRDEYGEHPDFFRNEDYCPHCGTLDKEHRSDSHCTHCKQPLPNWSQVRTYGRLTPYAQQHKPGQGKLFETGGEPPAPKPEEHDTEPAHPLSLSHPANKRWLQRHLIHHHGSDPTFFNLEHGDEAGTFDHEAAHRHHLWLHHNSSEAKRVGFFPVEHGHASMPEYKTHHEMTPEELHVHLVSEHSTKLVTPQEAINQHKMLHEADAGGYDNTGTLPLAHMHVQGHEPPLKAHPKDLYEHLALEHGTGAVKDVLGNLKPHQITQGHLEAAHQHLHYPGVKNDHEHLASGAVKRDEDEQAHYEVRKHLLNAHGTLTAPGNSLEDQKKYHTKSHHDEPIWSHTHGGSVLHPHEGVEQHLMIDHGWDPEDPSNADVINHSAQHTFLHHKDETPPDHDHNEDLDQHPPPSHDAGPWALGQQTHHLHQAMHLELVHGVGVPSGAEGAYVQALHHHWHEHPEHAPDDSESFQGHHDHKSNGDMMHASATLPGWHDPDHPAHAAPYHLWKHLEQVHGHPGFPQGEAQHRFEELHAAHDEHHASGKWVHTHEQPISAENPEQVHLPMSAPEYHSHLEHAHNTLVPWNEGYDSAHEKHKTLHQQTPHGHDEHPHVHPTMQPEPEPVHWEDALMVPENLNSHDLHHHLVDEHDMTPDDIEQHGGPEHAHLNMHEQDEDQGHDPGHKHALRLGSMLTEHFRTKAEVG